MVSNAVKILMPRHDLGGVPVRNFVHLIDNTAHPTWPVGWRWSVSIGDDPRAVPLMLQAGVAATEAQACKAGDDVAAAVVNALDVLGIAVDWPGPTVLDFDPTPPERIIA